MRKILAILQRDWISTSRDAILLYVTAAPLLITLGLRLFMPSVGQTSINVVLAGEPEGALRAHLEDYMNVEIVPDEQALERRVLANDDAVGIIPTASGGFRLVLEGNESHDSTELPEIVLQTAGHPGDSWIETREVGSASLPYREWIGTFTGLVVLFLSSIIMAFHIIEDKETRMVQALGVTPLNRGAYILARSLFVVVFGLLMVFAALWILGLSGFNPLLLLITAVLGSLSAVLFGFIIGALSSNQIAGIANIKFGFLLILLPGLLTLVIPEKFWAVLYWLPTYWTFTSFKAILVEGQTWTGLRLPFLWTLLTSAAFLVGMSAWLRNRLDFARN